MSGVSGHRPGSGMMSRLPRSLTHLPYSERGNGVADQGSNDGLIRPRRLSYGHLGQQVTEPPALTTALWNIQPVPGPGKFLLSVSILKESGAFDISRAMTSLQTVPTYFVSVNGLRIAYRRFGASSPLPLVYVNHLRGSMDTLDPLLFNSIAKSREVIVYDSAGVGHSEGTVPDSIPEMAVVLVNLLAAP
ncbi:hypothetical protein BDW75DRAFT_245902 [Aspergillus navahoensis]